MILNRLILENYGLFAERNEFDLQTRVKYRKQRPIILFGGKNGAGKTTFLEAIRLLLYGRNALGNRISNAEYEAHLLSRVHRNKNDASRASYAKVGLEFGHVVGGEKQLFFVERSWVIKRSEKIEEFFKVEKDGEKFEDISAEHWPAFVADIVPYRLSQLFFFDGEKIKNIAEDLSSQNAIGDSIQSLLGLDVVSALKSHLKVYRSRVVGKTEAATQDRELRQANGRLGELESDLSGKSDELSEIASKIDGVKCSIQNLEVRIQERGGSFADKREANIALASRVKEEIDGVTSSIRTKCEGPIPFTLCPSVSQALLRQMNEEDEAAENRSSILAVANLQKHLVSASRKAEAHQEMLEKFVSEQVKEFTGKLKPSSTGREIHNFSKSDARAIEELLQQRAPDVRKHTLEDLQRLEDLSLELFEVNRDLEKAPDASDVADFLQALNSKHQKLGSLEEKEATLKDQLRGLENEVNQVKRTIDAIESKIASQSKEKNKIEQIGRINEALDTYRDRLTKAKIEMLQSEVSECFNRLSRKTDFVRGISIDSETFSVSLLDKQRRSIPKEDLSSGEKQIFAIAMLWGLARTSGRPLPVVIDTPLGRLDSDHRKNLIENYFPNAGHQVILLSTDTEVDQGLFEALTPNISQSYHLVYDQNEGKTKPEEGYFWRS